MKKYKKFAAAAIVMLITIMPFESTVYAADGADKTGEENRVVGFSDIKADDWYSTAVEYVYKKGIMSGITSSDFGPKTEVSRAMAVQILYKMSGGEKSDTTSKFTDVKSSDWFSDAVNWAAEKGIVSGYADGSFMPNQLVTREELAAFIYRYSGSPDDAGMVLREFDDYTNISDFAKMPMLWCVHNGLISGLGDGTLAPKNSVTRSQLASIAMRYMELNK